MHARYKLVNMNTTLNIDVETDLAPHLSPANDPSDCCSLETYSTAPGTLITSSESYKSRICWKMKNRDHNFDRLLRPKG